MEDGYDSDLAYVGEHEQMPEDVARLDISGQFWDIVMEQTSHGDLPDGYPFTPEGSQELKDNPPKPH